MTGTWRIDYRNADDRKPEFFDTKQAAEARVTALRLISVEALAWFDSESDGPWVEPVTRISTRFEGDNWTALGEGA